MALLYSTCQVTRGTAGLADAGNESRSGVSSPRMRSRPVRCRTLAAALGPRKHGTPHSVRPLDGAAGFDYLGGARTAFYNRLFLPEFRSVPGAARMPID